MHTGGVDFNVSYVWWILRDTKEWSGSKFWLFKSGDNLEVDPVNGSVF